jgi:hypothetical protein
MTDMMVKIMVEVLDILATATKEIKQSRFSEFILLLKSLKAHAMFRKVLKEGGWNHETGRRSTKVGQNDE